MNLSSSINFFNTGRTLSGLCMKSIISHKWFVTSRTLTVLCIASLISHKWFITGYTFNLFCIGPVHMHKWLITSCTVILFCIIPLVMYHQCQLKWIFLYLAPDEEKTEQFFVFGICCEKYGKYSACKKYNKNETGLVSIYV